MKKSLSKKIMGKVYIVFLIAFGAYLAYQLVSVSNMEIKTEQAIIQTVHDEFTATGFIVRDETIIDAPANLGGHPRFELKDGERISGGGKIATIFSTAESLELSLEISRLSGIAQRYDELLKRAGISANEALETDKNLLNSAISISAASDSGDVGLAVQTKENMGIMLAGRELMTRGNNSITEGRDTALAEKKALQSKLGTAIKSYTAPAAGAFVSYCDGYEELLTTKIASGITYEQIVKLLAEEVAEPRDNLGKIVTSYEWNFICPVSDGQLKGLEKGKKYQIRFPFNPGKPSSVTLKDIRTSETDKNLLVFSSSDTTLEINLLRKQTVQIVRSSFQGLRVSSQARRVKDGVVGVYVHSGMTVEFKTIEEIFTTDTLSLVKVDPSSKTALKLYDKIIVSGKDLYEGKVIE